MYVSSSPCHTGRFDTITTRVSPRTDHFCSTQLGRQLWLAKRATPPTRSASMIRSPSSAAKYTASTVPASPRPLASRRDTHSATSITSPTYSHSSVPSSQSASARRPQ